jgi:flagellar operon protein
MSQRVFRPYTHPLIYNDNNKILKAPPNQQLSFKSEFQSAVKQKNDELIISKHAQQRLEQRGIQIKESKWREISEKILEAKQMGVKDSLVLLDDAALIISAKNQTVITAMDRKEAATQIFTNINGTILMDS